jgi:4-hydroxy-tetrahydrodipicolinate reductase
MRIALIGYGKMGKTIEEIAISRGHQIVIKSTSNEPISTFDMSEVDVAIEFTIPGLAVNHIQHCVLNNVPIVVGTTAWVNQLEEVSNFIKQNNGSLLHSSNFSIGVNIFFDINKRLAKLMSPYEEYRANVNEIHHTEKLDAPSGTAVTIANDIMLENDRLTSWVHSENTSPKTSNSQIGVTSHREENVPGTHIVEYNSEIDQIAIKHTAYNRKGFALGAVLAAEWIKSKKGVFTMQDVIKF